MLNHKTRILSEGEDYVHYLCDFCGLEFATCNGYVKNYYNYNEMRYCDEIHCCEEVTMQKVLG